MTSRSEFVTPGPRLRGILSPSRHVDDEDEVVGERAAERQGQVVAARLDQHDVGVRETLVELARPRRGSCSGRRARRCADRSRSRRRRRVRAPARRRGVARTCCGVLLGEDVVGDDERAVARGDQTSGRAPRSARSCRSRPARRCRYVRRPGATRAAADAASMGGRDGGCVGVSGHGASFSAREQTKLGLLVTHRHDVEQRRAARDLGDIAGRAPLGRVDDNRGRDVQQDAWAVR